MAPSGLLLRSTTGVGVLIKFFYEFWCGVLIKFFYEFFRRFCEFLPHNYFVMEHLEHCRCKNKDVFQEKTF